MPEISSDTDDRTFETYFEPVEKRHSAKEELEYYDDKIASAHRSIDKKPLEVDQTFRQQLAKWRRKARARQVEVSKLTESIKDLGGTVSADVQEEWQRKTVEVRGEEWVVGAGVQSGRSAVLVDMFTSHTVLWS